MRAALSFLASVCEMLTYAVAGAGVAMAVVLATVVLSPAGAWPPDMSHEEIVGSVTVLVVAGLILGLILFSLKETRS